ncbi:MAG: DUF6221 family protein [Rhodoglobus sp.]
MTLTEFMEARIADDEAAQVDHDDYGPRGWHDFRCDLVASEGYRNCDCGIPARVLAECAAKRAILAEHELGKAGYVGCTVENDPECMCCSHGGEYPGGWPCATLDALLSVYTEHPDYREEWRR